MTEPTHIPPATQPSKWPPFVRYVVLGWLCAAAALAYTQRLQLGVGVKPIREDLSLSATQLGWAMSAFFITYALFQIPGGWFAQRRGSRVALVAAIVLCSLSAGLTGAAIGIASLL